MLKKLLGLVAAAYLLGACASEEPPPPPPPPPPAPQNFMVFFDWDSTKLSDASLNVLEQARDSYKNKQDARITATGHTDTSGSEAYNMALSLRRAVRMLFVDPLQDGVHRVGRGDVVVRRQRLLDGDPLDVEFLDQVGRIPRCRVTPAHSVRISSAV